MAQPITPEIANRVWDILVEDAGASKHEYNREAFVVYATGRETIPEYRFGGWFGFGGKVRFRDGKWFVSYYSEDKTQGRDALAEITNEHLATLNPTPAAEGAHECYYGNADGSCTYCGSLNQQPASEPQAVPPELEPCPFCPDGGLPKVSDQSSEDGYWAAYCKKCKCGTASFAVKSAAIKQWNTRTSTASALAEALYEAAFFARNRLLQDSYSDAETIDKLNRALARWEKGEGR